MESLQHESYRMIHGKKIEKYLLVDVKRGKERQIITGRKEEVKRKVRKVTMMMMMICGCWKARLPSRQTKPSSLTLVQRSCQCVDAAAVCVRGQGLLRGHGRNVVG